MEFLNTDYLNIINEIGKWKVVPMKKLYECMGCLYTYDNFRQKIIKLEKYKWVQSISESRKIKFLTLTQKGSGVSRFSSPDYEKSESRNHDMITSNLLMSLVNLKGFTSAEVLELDEEMLDPDGLVTGCRNNIDYMMAIEVELTAKSRKRLSVKWNKYVDSKSVDYVLYVTNKLSLYEAYKRRLSEFNEKINSKIILCLDTNMSYEQFNYKYANVWFKGREKTFCAFFGISQ